MTVKSRFGLPGGAYSLDSRFRGNDGGDTGHFIVAVNAAVLWYNPLPCQRLGDFSLSKEKTTMTIINDDQPARAIAPIPEENQAKARAYIQGAVYCWCKNQSGEMFAVRDLFGGVNTDWGGTPLQVIYNFHYESFKNRNPNLSTEEIHEKAADEAAKDVGRLMKSVLQNDKRNFESSDAGMANGYRWISTD